MIRKLLSVLMFLKEVECHKKKEDYMKVKGNALRGLQDRGGNIFQESCFHDALEGQIFGEVPRIYDKIQGIPSKIRKKLTY